jgi:predicted Zn finger-like uncharacterized protein
LFGGNGGAMPVRVQCPNCATKLNVKDELIDRKVKCPKCSTVFSATDKLRAAKPAAIEGEEAVAPVVPRPKKAARRSEEFTFDLRSVSTKHPNGYAYRVTATDQGIAFTCLTVDEAGRRPSEEESAKFDFRLEWDEIAEVRKPSTIFDPEVVFVGKDGQKTKCVFAEAGQEEAAFKGLKNAFGTLPDVTFTYERTPVWKLLALPGAFTVGMVVVGIIAYLVLARMEETGEGGRMNVIIVLIYRYLGKYGVLALFLLAAVGGILWSVKKWRTYASMEPSEDG